MFDLSDPSRVLSLFASVAAFGLVLSLWLMGMTIWINRRKKRLSEVQQRLDFAQSVGATSNSRVLRLWHDGQEATTVVPAIIKKGLFDRVETICMHAGWEVSGGTALARLVAVLSLVGGAGYLITSSIMVGVMSAMGALVLFWIHLNQRISKRTTTFERQLIDALDLAARSLRVGHPLVGSFRLIAEEIPAPVGHLFAEVCQQQALGMAMDQALRNIAEESTSEDLKLFSTSVVIQLSSGGNLADMMERLANVIRDRQRLARRVKVLTAQTQFSKRVLLALPFLVFVSLNLINPAYMRPLYATGTGQLILLAASMGLMMGWIMMNWLSKLSF